MIRAWARRTAELHAELAAIAEVDPRWWVLAAGVALVETRASADDYLACDAEADADTFMGYRAPAPHDPIEDAFARARAARTALRELDGTLPGQPLAVTIDRARGGQTRPSALDIAAFAIGDTCVIGRLDDPTLAHQLAAALRGEPPPPWHGAPPFVCIALGDEPIETARHGHRRAWTAQGGPWLGLGRAGELAIVSTCHLIIDGYGHALLTARIAALGSSINGHAIASRLPALAPVAGAVPLAFAWHELGRPVPRLIPLAYALGCLLHRELGARDARFSPTIQIPVARGRKGDPLRLRRRIVAATTSVRFVNGIPEPFAAFEARARGVFTREAGGAGLVSRLLAAGRAVPVPLAWKRRSISAKRPRWLEDFAEVIGGRALLSRIAVDTPLPLLCAASSPSRLVTEADPVGGCAITIIDDGARAAISIAGSGFPPTFLDRLLRQVKGALVEHHVAEGAAERGA